MTTNGSGSNQPQPLPNGASNPGPWQGFRVPSQDTHGHSERLFFRLQPGMARDIHTVINLHIWPYRDTGDLVRHAVHRHMAWLQSQVPFQSVTKQVDIILEIMREEEFNADFHMVFDKLGQRVANYVGMASEREARSIVRRVQQYIDDMPEGDWKDRYQREMDTRYGHLKKAVELGQWAEDEAELPAPAGGGPPLVS